MEHRVFDAANFRKCFQVLCLHVPKKSTSSILKNLKIDLFKRANFRSITPLDENPLLNQIFLDEGYTKEEDLPESVKSAIESSGIELKKKEIELSANQLTSQELFDEILPDGVPKATSYETAGHIAHLNLKPHHLPFKESIAQIILAKNPHIKSVVNKTSTIQNQFRTFPYELIGGEANMKTTLRESNCTFEFNFDEVYWNSRLQMEHGRLVSKFTQKDTICDMFAGIGPFALPAGKNQGCTVYANDLNPKSYEFLVNNIKLNKVSDKVIPHNLDGRDFARYLITGKSSDPNIEPLASLPSITHVIMNLPGSAIEFLDVWRDLLHDPCFVGDLPTIHCYCFSAAENAEQDVKERVEAVIGCSLVEYTVHNVRKVAPKKDMLCISFPFPPVKKRKGTEGEAEGDEGVAKKPKTQS